MIRHDQKIEDEIFGMYETLNIGNTEVCLNCRYTTQNLSKPNSFWFVGEKYKLSQYKTLFIGKNARGNPGVDRKSYFEFRDFADEYCNGSSAYWNYTRSISEKLYDFDSGDNIAYTNIIKCNNSITIDTTSNLMKVNCISRMQVIKEEIKILKPDNIVFLTSWEYDEHFVSIFDEIISIKSEYIDVGKKKMPWWEFTGSLENLNINVLRIGHPERKSKAPYVSEVTNWIKNQA